MNILLNILHDDHKNYLDLLNLLNTEVEILGQGGSPDFVRMYDIMNFMVMYPDIVHHPHEEIIFSELKENDPEIGPVLDKLNDEHKKLATLRLSLKKLLHQVTSESIVSKNKILEDAQKYIQLLSQHIDIEEGEVFPKARQVLNDANWESINEKLTHVEDPLFGDVVLEQFSALYNGIFKNVDQIICK